MKILSVIRLCNNVCLARDLEVLALFSSKWPKMPLQRPSSTSSALAIVSSENGQPPPSPPPPPHPTDGCHLSIKGWKPFMSVKFYVFCQGLVEFSMIMYFAYYKAIISQVSGRTNVETDSTPIKGQSICLLDVQGGCWHARQHLTHH